MSGELALFDISRVNPVSADYIDAVVAGDVSATGIVWLKNIGDAQVDTISVAVEEVAGSDGNTMLKLSEGVPLAGPPAAPLLSLVGGGAIVGPKTLHYKVAALGVGSGPTLPSAAASITILSGAANIQVSWSAVANAVGYAVYHSEDGVEFYLADFVFGGTSYLDVSGAPDVSAERPVTSNQAFRAGTFTAGPISISSLDPEAARPIIFRAEPPVAATYIGNTRKADIVIEGYTV